MQGNYKMYEIKNASKNMILNANKIIKFYMIFTSFVVVTKAE